MKFPELPPQLRDELPPALWNWWQDFRSYVLQGFTTQQDVTMLTAGKGIVLTNAAGTVTKRIKLNDAGTDITVENV